MRENSHTVNLYSCRAPRKGPKLTNLHSPLACTFEMCPATQFGSGASSLTKGGTNKCNTPCGAPSRESGGLPLDIICAAQIARSWNFIWISRAPEHEIKCTWRREGQRIPSSAYTECSSRASSLNTHWRYNCMLRQRLNSLGEFRAPPAGWGISKRCNKRAMARNVR
jgi:hypothetical protein